MHSAKRLPAIGSSISQTQITMISTTIDSDIDRYIDNDSISILVLTTISIHAQVDNDNYIEKDKYTDFGIDSDNDIAATGARA